MFRQAAHALELLSHPDKADAVVHVNVSFQKRKENFYSIHTKSTESESIEPARTETYMLDKKQAV